VEPENKEGDQFQVLVPDDYKIEPAYGCYKVLDYSEDCNIVLQEGDKIVVQNSMVEKIDIEGQRYTIVLENYIVGVSYAGDLE
tara:strand:+ start:640 stop:888 length:249 start_codon:yes stop_codon:yes gene_type:complete